MDKTNKELMNRKKRVQRLKKIIMITAIALVVLSFALNIYLLIRVINLTNIVNSIYETGFISLL